MIVQPMSKVTMKLETVTPEQAEEYLKTSKLNRTITESDVILYSVIMGRKEWFPYPPVEFDLHGKMINGHHRMHAIKLCGVATDMFVVRGLTPRNQEVMDTGRIRRVTDQLKMYKPNVTHRKNRTASASICAYLLTGANVKIKTLPDFMHWHKLFEDGLEWAIDTFSSDKILRPASIIGSLAFAHQTNPKKLEEFGQQLLLGEGLKVGDPAHTLRRSIIQTHPGQRSGSYRGQMTRKVLNCAEAFLLNERILKVMPSDHGRQYFLEAFTSIKRAQTLAAPWLVEDTKDEEQSKAG